jgi:hypothetical protein
MRNPLRRKPVVAPYVPPTLFGTVPANVMQEGPRRALQWLETGK